MIGYYGMPPLDILEDYRESRGEELIDLDVDYGHEDLSGLPKVYCQIIRNILSNAAHYKSRLSLIVCSVGQEKCDGGRYAAQILKSKGFNLLQVRNEYPKSIKQISISTSSMPLKEKILKIMDTVHSRMASSCMPCKPVMGFWGVPPSDLELLDMFPDETHVFGWTRCVEAGAGHDLALECYVEYGLPTVFFTQSFCQKAALAKHLADRYNGLYIDIDRHATKSTKAKIEAFVKLRTVKEGLVQCL